MREHEERLAMENFMLLSVSSRFFTVLSLGAAGFVGILYFSDSFSFR
jgi:hypothetical protein